MAVFGGGDRRPVNCRGGRERGGVAAGEQVERPRQLLGRAEDVAVGRQQAVLAVAQVLAAAAAGEADYQAAAGQRFERRQAEALRVAGGEEDRGGGERRGGLALRQPVDLDEGHARVAREARPEDALNHLQVAGILARHAGDLQARRRRRRPEEIQIDAGMHDGARQPHRPADEALHVAADRDGVADAPGAPVASPLSSVATGAALSNQRIGSPRRRWSTNAGIPARASASTWR